MLVADTHRTTFSHPERGSHRVSQVRPQSPHLLEFQVLTDEQAKAYKHNPFNLTKVWPKADYPPKWA
jgi:hypothetical protein